MNKKGRSELICDFEREMKESMNYEVSYNEECLLDDFVMFLMREGVDIKEDIN